MDSTNKVNPSTMDVHIIQFLRLRFSSFLKITPCIILSAYSSS